MKVITNMTYYTVNKIKLPCRLGQESPYNISFKKTRIFIIFLQLYYHIWWLTLIKINI